MKTKKTQSENYYTCNLKEFICIYGINYDISRIQRDFFPNMDAAIKNFQKELNYNPLVIIQLSTDSEIELHNINDDLFTLPLRFDIRGNNIQFSEFPTGYSILRVEYLFRNKFIEFECADLRIVGNLVPTRNPYINSRPNYHSRSIKNYN